MQAAKGNGQLELGQPPLVTLLAEVSTGVAEEKRSPAGAVVALPAGPPRPPIVPTSVKDTMEPTAKAALAMLREGSADGAHGAVVWAKFSTYPYWPVRSVPASAQPRHPTPSRQPS